MTPDAWAWNVCRTPSVSANSMTAKAAVVPLAGRVDVVAYHPSSGEGSVAFQIALYPGLAIGEIDGE